VVSRLQQRKSETVLKAHKVGVELWNPTQYSDSGKYQVQNIQKDTPEPAVVADPTETSLSSEVDRLLEDVEEYAHRLDHYPEDDTPVLDSATN
jgi:hypothetical protein